MSSNSIPKPALKRFAQRNSYRTVRFMKEIPEVHAFDNAISIGVNPNIVSIKPIIRPVFLVIVIFCSFILGNVLTVSL